MAEPSLFPARDHDHNRCAADAISNAEVACARAGQRLTPIRRHVLEALLSGHRPMGAYDVIEQVARAHKRPAPITIYRALDFLKEHGLVHRIESRNAFLACAGGHKTGAMVAFLICDVCGTAAEAPLPDIAHAIETAADAAHFAPAMSVVEITGTCNHCRKSRAANA